MENERSDGELSQIQGHLSFEASSRTTRQQLDIDLQTMRMANYGKLVSDIKALEELNNYWGGRIVYSFKEDASKDTDLALINCPIFAVDDKDNSKVTVKYLFVSKSGVGRITFPFIDATLIEGEATVADVKFHTPATEAALFIGDPNFILKERLISLNDYFSNPDSTQSSAKLFISPPEKDDSRGVLDIHQKDKGTETIELDFSASIEEIEADLQYVLEKLQAKRQGQIEKRNASLDMQQRRLSVADSVGEYLTSSFGDEIVPDPNKKKGSKRERLFDKLKRKRG